MTLSCISRQTRTLQQKITKLEARMTGKSSSSSSFTPSARQSAPPTKFGAEGLSGASFSSDSDDDNSGEYLIQHNTLKTQRVQEDDRVTVQQSEGVADGRIKVAEAVDIRPSPDDSNRKKQGRGRGRSSRGRGRGSKATDQMRSLTSSSASSLSNGQLEHPQHKESGPREQLGNGERASSQEEMSFLRGKNASLEEDLSKSRQETADHQQHCRQLEKELKDLKERDQQMKTKRGKKQE